MRNSRQNITIWVPWRRRSLTAPRLSCRAMVVSANFLILRFRGVLMRLAWANVRVSAVRTAMVAVPVIALASGCSAGGSTGAMGSGSLTVAVVPGIESAPLSVAAQEGLFRQHGLNVTVKDYSSVSAEYQALASDQVQLAFGDYTDFFYEQDTDHVSLRLIADGYDAAANSMEIL